MRSKTTIGLSVAAVVLAAGAVAAVIANAPSTRIGSGHRLFPQLEARIDDVTTIEIVNATGHFSIERRGDQWVVPARDFDAARLEDVRNLLVSLARAELVDSKTSQPALYERLNLDDPADGKSKAVQITLKDSGGQIAAALLVGKRRAAKGAGDPSGDNGGSVYVRRVGEAQSWLATAPTDVPATALDWIDRKLADLSVSEVLKVTVERAEGGFVIDRARPEENLVVNGVPTGMKSKSVFEINQVGTVLEFLFFDDVAPAASVKADGKDPVVVSYQTVKGLTVTARVLRDGETVWTTFEATATGEEAEKQAAEFNARTKGWAYKLPSFKVSKIDIRMQDLVEPVNKPAS